MTTAAPDTTTAAALWVPTAQLRPWEKNPRRNDKAIAKVCESIERFGFGSPIVARQEDRRIIAGHTRWLAAKQLGLAEVPVRFLELSDNDAKLLSLADNKLGEIAEWDDGVLGEVLKELLAEDANLAAAGFEADELDRLLGEFAADELDAVEEDETPPPPENPTSVPGEVYVLGPHRLLCGDSTSIADVEKALGGEKAALLFTDPPYGVSYRSRMAKGGTAHRFAKIENDDLKPDELLGFLRDCFASAAAGLRPGAAIYVCHADQRPGLRPVFEQALLDNAFHIAGCIIWVKQAASMGWQDYRNRYEPLLYGWTPGADHRRVNDRSETNVWEISRDAAVSYEHPTQKPVALPARAIRNSTALGETVLDLFGGSGSTLIAAAKTGRKAVLVEKDPGYCDVIRGRWERFSKKAAGQKR